MLNVFFVNSIAFSLRTTSALDPKLIGEFSLKHAAVTGIAQSFPGSDSPSLLISTFAPFGSEPVYYVPNLASSIKSGKGQFDVRTLETDTKWTNYVGMAPLDAIPGHPSVVATAGGFLVPGQGLGTVDLFDVSEHLGFTHHKVSTDKQGWFYHKLIWYDVDRDGLLDIVAARATAPKDTKGELLWLKQPSMAAFTSPWKEQVIISGPDVDFIFEDIDGDQKPEIVAAEFFSSPRLMQYSCPKASWDQCSDSTVTSTTIDGESGPFFTVERVDLNGDGKPDLLVTNNENDGTGSLFAYEQPQNVADNWKKHVLGTGYKPLPTLIPMPGNHSRGSPGGAQAFHVSASEHGVRKPRILLSGDDGGFVAILTAKSQEATNWSYGTIFVCNSTGTIGGVSAVDMDGDGVTEIAVPFYDEGKVEIYTFTDAPEPLPSAQCIECLARKDPVHLSEAFVWCYKDQRCHVVGSKFNPCAATECASAARLSQCACKSCNDQECQLLQNGTTNLII